MKTLTGGKRNRKDGAEDKATQSTESRMHTYSPRRKVLMKRSCFTGKTKVETWGSGCWIRAKAGQHRHVERMVICQLLFLSSSCSSEQARWRNHYPRSAYQKPLTLIRLRALQLRRGNIFIVTLIDRCQKLHPFQTSLNDFQCTDMF